MNTIEEMFYEIPPITRTYGSLLFSASILCHFGILSPFQLYFNLSLIVWKHQFWRLLTTFLYIGPLGLDFLFHAFFVLRYCRMLEEGKFRNSAEDFVMLFVFAIGWLWLIAPFLDILFLASPLTFVLVYVWSRHNPAIRVQFLGLLSFTAPFLPWFLLAFSFLLHPNSFPINDILGIAIGHLYYFLSDVYPTIRPGRKWVAAPPFLKRAVRSLLAGDGGIVGRLDDDGGIEHGGFDGGVADEQIQNPDQPHHDIDEVLLENEQQQNPNDNNDIDQVLRQRQTTASTTTIDQQ